MLKNAYFWRKIVTIASALGDPPPNPRLPPGPRCFAPSPFLAQIMRFITLKKNYSKCSAFAFSALLHLFFTSNSVFLLTEGARIFLAPGRRVP